MVFPLFATTFFITILIAFFATVIIFFGYMCWKMVMETWDYDEKKILDRIKSSKIFTLLKVAAYLLILIWIANLFKVLITTLLG
jgi:TRAP-type C4-dicarboxylate transport system permease small subunit